MSERLKPLAQELVATTGVDSLSDLLSLLLTRYGRHLRDTWEIPTVPQQVLSSVASPNPAQVFAPVAEKPQIQEPQYVQQVEPSPEPYVQFLDPDPVIERLSGLIDTF